MSKVYALGIDVGSTTVKTVILDEDKKIIYSKYVCGRIYLYHRRRKSKK